MTDQELSDQLPGRAQQGSAQGSHFREIYRTQFQYIWRVLRRFGIGEMELEDCTHDVFVVVYRNLQKYDSSRPLRPWLGGIAFRVASDFRRRAYHRREQLQEQGRIEVMEAAQHNQTEALVAGREAQKTVYKALATLDFDRRALFVLHDIEGHTVPEIASSMDIPLNTAYSRLRLARQQFQKAVHLQTGNGGQP